MSCSQWETGFKEMTTGGWDQRLLPTKELIHIDANAEKIGRNYRASAWESGDAEDRASEELASALKQKTQFQYGRGFSEECVLRHFEVEKLKAEDALAEPETEPDTAGACIIPSIWSGIFRSPFQKKHGLFRGDRGGHGMGYPVHGAGRALFLFRASRIRGNGICHSRTCGSKVSQLRTPRSLAGGRWQFSDERHGSCHGSKLRYPGNMDRVQQRHARHGPPRNALPETASTGRNS